LFTKNIKIEIKRPIILSVVLYGCETWSLTLREEIRLRFLRRIFGPKQDNVREEWRKLHNGERNDPHSSPNIIWMMKSRRMTWVWHVAHMG